jgi:hypothetical protein
MGWRTRADDGDDAADFLDHYRDLPDGRKWACAAHLREIGQPPPQPTFDAAVATPDFALRSGFPWESIRWTGGSSPSSARPTSRSALSRPPSAR